MATDPLHNPHAPPGPTYMPQYKLPALAQANALDDEATAKFNTGNQDAQTGDNFVRIYGIPGRGAVPGGHRSSFKLNGVRYALITSDPCC